MKPSKFQLYVRLVFGALILFCLIGTCSGDRTRPTLAFIIITMMWTGMRIVYEAFEALIHLTANAGDKLPPLSHD